MIESDTADGGLVTHSTGTSVSETVPKTTTYTGESAAVTNRAALGVAGSRSDSGETPREPTARTEAEEAMAERHGPPE